MHNRRLAAISVAAAAAAAVSIIVAHSTIQPGTVDANPHDPQTKTFNFNEAFQSSSARGEASSKSDGIPDTLDTGEILYSYGPQPILIRNHEYQHNAAGPNSAGYLQTDIGRHLRRIGATFEFPFQSSASVAIVSPLKPWGGPSGTGTTPAGIHFVIDANGDWHCSYWNGHSEEIYLSSKLFPNLAEGNLAGTGSVSVQLAIDEEAGTLSVRLPDGKIASGASDKIVSSTGSVAIWELFELQGLSSRSASIKRVWAD
jgi:hypothetical protein